jgi:hypothetical protein
MQPITISVSTGHFVLERHGLSPLLIDRVDGSLTQPPPEEIQHMNLGPPRTVCGILGVIRVHGDAYLIVLNHFTRVAAFQWHDQLREIYQVHSLFLLLVPSPPPFCVCVCVPQANISHGFIPPQIRRIFPDSLLR